MANDALYMKLPYDTSGSMSKNRFRAELLWGVGKFLDLMETDMDFTMVFDYVCDIEVHYDNSFDFYQIKTHKGTNSYTASSLTKIPSGKKNSILGTLYKIYSVSGKGTITLALVSNSNYKGVTDTKTSCLISEFPDADKTLIIKNLSSELGVSPIDLSKMVYIHTGINLENPSNEIRGKLILTFEKIRGYEPSNPNALYRLVEETVIDKACYEYTASQYEDLVKMKGISRTEFDRMLDIHSVNARTGLAEAKDYISGLKSITAKRKYNQALIPALKYLTVSKNIKNLEIEMVKCLLSQDDIPDIEFGINLLTDIFHDRFPTEIDNAVKTVIYVLILKRFEIGVYDDEEIVI